MTVVCDLPLSRRVGARIWIAWIMLSWGIVSGAMASIPHSRHGRGFSPSIRSKVSGFFLASPAQSQGFHAYSLMEAAHPPGGGSR